MAILLDKRFGDPDNLPAIDLDGKQFALLNIETNQVIYGFVEENRKKYCSLNYIEAGFLNSQDYEDFLCSYLGDESIVLELTFSLAS